MGSETLAPVYNPDHRQQFDGQKNFLYALCYGFELVEEIVVREGLHGGWKLITGKRRDGNMNPNWKDQMWYTGFAILNNIHKIKPCPEMPLLSREIDRKGDFPEQEDWWFHVWRACELYEQLANDYQKARRAYKLQIEMGASPDDLIKPISPKQRHDGKPSQFTLSYPEVGCQPPTLEELPNVPELRKKIEKKIENEKKRKAKEAELNKLREVE